ncbi:hypothetical protein ACJMK2_038699, partial [Sinanodonta woodiana]
MYNAIQLVFSLCPINGQFQKCQLITLGNLKYHGFDTGINIPHLVETGEIITGRKRQTNVCSACCGDGLCNDDECEVVR